jgi:hypothetical protein
MLGGGFVGGPHQPALKQTALTLNDPDEGGPSCTLTTTALKQTAAERRRSRTTTTSHTDGDAPAIRTLWEGGPSECWGEGLPEAHHQPR